MSDARVERLAEAFREFWASDADDDAEFIRTAPESVETSIEYARALLPVVEQEIAAARAEGRALGRYEMTVGHKPDPRDPNYQAGYGRGRAEHGERIAQAIESHACNGSPESCADVLAGAPCPYDDAARIARTAASTEGNA